MTTVVLPGGSTVPGAIDCVTVIKFDGVQLSVINPLVWKFGITGGQPVTLIENGGQFGGVVSPPVTITRKPHEAMLPCASVAVQVTVFVPSGKNEPDGGMQTTLAIGVPQADVDAQVLLGDLMVVGGGALWAATTLVAKATPLIKAPAEKVLGYQVAMSIPILGFSAWISGETMTQVPGPLALSLMAYQAIWVVGMTFMLWFSLVKVYSASKLSAFSFITPLFGVVGGYFIMHDTLTPAFAAAAVLVIAGLYLVNRPSPPAIDPLLNVTKT